MSAEASSASSSSLDTSEKTEALNKASDLLSEGKRHMVCGEIPKAVNVYEEAVQLLVKSCGELSKDCAEAYFSCGSALLELGRMETSVLGAALDGVDVEEEKEEEANEQFEKPTESEGEERQKLREEVYEAMAEGEREELQKTVSDKCQKPSTDEELQTCDKTKENIESKTDEERCDSGLTEHIGHVPTGEGLNTADSGHTKQQTHSDVVEEASAVAAHDKGKQGDNEHVNTGAGKEQAHEMINICSGELQGDPAAVDQKELANTAEASETKIIDNSDELKSEESKMAGDCEDQEMADKDAPDEAEEDDAEEEEEENINEAKDIQEGEDIEGEDKEEDVPNFQLAWEYLDLAKVIYLKSESAEDQLKAAECFIKLGEVSMETEQHVTAAEDMESALKIQQKLLPSEDRLIAETHYQLGLAYGLGKEFKLAIQQYTEAIGVMEAKIASLKRLVGEAAVQEDNKENAASEQVKKYQDEIKELQELVLEMRNKIEDAQEEAKDVEKMKEIAKEALGFSGFSKKSESPIKRAESNAGDRVAEVDENGEKKATDIAHLIRKKRKPDDEVHAPNDQELKKIRHDDSPAAAALAGTVNGSAADVAEQNKTEPLSTVQIPS